MTHGHSTRQSSSPDNTWLEIERMVDELSRLSESAVSSREFHQALIERSVCAMAAKAGAVWRRDAKDQFLLEGATDLQSADFDPHAPENLALLELVARDAQPRLVTAKPDATSAEEGSFSSGLLILAPIVCDGRVQGVLEIVQRNGLDAVAQEGYLQFVVDLGALAADFHRRTRERELRDHSASQMRLLRILRRLHATLDPELVAAELANETHQWLNCDRVSVVVGASPNCRLAAVSGADQVDRRSSWARSVEQLCRTIVTHDGQPCWHDESQSTSGASSAANADAISAYLETSHARTLGVWPLQPPSPRGDDRVVAPLTGMLLIEQFDARRSRDSLHPLLASLVPHAALALSNALECNSLPFWRWLRRSRSTRRQRSTAWITKRRASVVAACCLVAVLALVRVDFSISARGELQPRRRREVFAPADGTLRELLVRHGQSVKRGDPLAKMQRTQLDLELSRVLGEIQTATQRLGAVQALRLAPSDSPRGDALHANQWAAEETELQELLTSLRQQREILQSQQSELELTSPIAGQVVSWDVEQRLDARPVQRGQSLLTIADLSGPWILELKLADERIEQVLEARHEEGAAVLVDYVLASDPGVVRHGKLTQVGTSTEPDEALGLVVPLTVSLDASRPHDPRPGATVMARVHCGRRSLGYVWFHDVWRWLQTRFWF